MADDEVRDDPIDYNGEVVICDYPAREIHGTFLLFILWSTYFISDNIGTLAQANNTTSRLTGITTGSSAANPLH